MSQTSSKAPKKNQTWGVGSLLQSLCQVVAQRLGRPGILAKNPQGSTEELPHMAVDSKNDHILEEGEFLLTDPLLLKNMRLSSDIQAPGSQAILVTQYTLITPTLITQLQRRRIKTLFAEPISETSVVAVAKHVDKMFTVLDEILSGISADINDVATSFQNQQDMQQFEALIKDNLKNIDQLFQSNPTEKLIALTEHHNGTARHSLIAAFHLMALGRELGWSDIKIVKAAFSVLNHDIGKTKINLETLNWPGRLNNEQWKEIQHHTLFGGRLLFQSNKKPDLIMLTALLHHEWYAAVEGKGYGGLTLFADFIKTNMGIDIPQIVKELDVDDRQIIQATALVDVVSALEERRAYKRGLDSFKVLIIMNTDAKMGHFNPQQYRAWHRSYLRQNPKLLPLGRRMALPREKERRVFTPMPTKKIRPTELLTYYEMEQMGILTVLQNIGMDMERLRRRGGLSLKVLNKIGQDKNLHFDFSESALSKQEINPLKTELVQEKQVIELDVWRSWLTSEELEKSGLLSRAKMRHFDLNLIHQNGGIDPARLASRDVTVPQEKLDKLGIQTLKELTIQLPGSENRLTWEDLQKLGVSEQQLKKAGCWQRIQQVKSGVPMEWLEQYGFSFDRKALGKQGIDPIRKIFYDIQVVEEISVTQAKFLIMREGDDLKVLHAMNAQNDLAPIQNLLLNKIGEVVMDFSDLIALPDLDALTMAAHWGSNLITEP